jgi:hypothetical protein
MTVTIQEVLNEVALRAEWLNIRLAQEGDDELVVAKDLMSILLEAGNLLGLATRMEPGDAVLGTLLARICEAVEAVRERIAHSELLAALDPAQATAH